MEQIFVQELVAWFAMTAPDLFATRDAAGDVETTGTLTRGQTIFDRRPSSSWGNKMEVVTQIDPAAVRQQIIAALLRSGRMIDERFAQ